MNSPGIRLSMFLNVSKVPVFAIICFSPLEYYLAAIAKTVGAITTYPHRYKSIDFNVLCCLPRLGIVALEDTRCFWLTCIVWYTYHWYTRLYHWFIVVYQIWTGIRLRWSYEELDYGFSRYWSQDDGFIFIWCRLFSTFFSLTMMTVVQR